MANTKITDLTSATAASGDEIPINRAGSDRKITLPLSVYATGNTTYYVRTDGSDSNNGLTNTAGGAFLTIQKAADVIYGINWNQYKPTIQVADGTYNVGNKVTFRYPHNTGWGVGGNYTIQGNTSSPSSVVIQSSKDCFELTGSTTVSAYLVLGFQFETAIGSGIETDNTASVFLDYCIFDCADVGMAVRGSAEVGNYLGGTITFINTVSGTTRYAYLVSGYCLIAGQQNYSGLTLTQAILRGSKNAYVQFNPLSVTGTATGDKYYFESGCLYHGGTAYKDPESLPASTAGYSESWVVVYDSSQTGKIKEAGFWSEAVLNDRNGNELIKFPATVTSAVNELTISNAATGNPPFIQATGGDTNVGLNFKAKGTPAIGYGFTGVGGTGTTDAGAIVWTTSGAPVRVVQATRTGGTNTPGIQVECTSINGGPASIGVTKFVDDTNGARLFLSKSRGTTPGTFTVVADGDVVGEVIFNGSDGTDLACAAGIRAVVHGSPGNNDMPGKLIFAVTADGAASATDRMSISNDGGVIIGTGTTSPGAGKLRVDGVELGHDTANTLTASSGVLSVEGVAVAMTGKQTIWVPASAMTPAASNGAAATTRAINTITTGFLAFDQTTSESAYFNVTFPKSWNEGTVTAQVYWTTTGGGASETIEFEISGGCFANDAAINVTGIGTAVAHTDTWIADDDVHVTAEGSAITLSNAAVDTVAWFRIVRDVANDDLTADAELIGVKLFYTTDAGNDA
jgi:hypothetical protein